MANIADHNGRETQNKFFFSVFFGATHLCRVSCRIFFCFPSFVISFFYLELSYFSCYVIVMFLELIQWRVFFLLVQLQRCCSIDRILFDSVRCVSSFYIYREFSLNHSIRSSPCFFFPLFSFHRYQL